MQTSSSTTKVGSGMVSKIERKYCRFSRPFCPAYIFSIRRAGSMPDSPILKGERGPTITFLFPAPTCGPGIDCTPALLREGKAAGWACGAGRFATLAPKPPEREFACLPRRVFKNEFQGHLDRKSTRLNSSHL